MLSGEIILEHLKSQPFRPFRLHLSSGRSFLVRHPELVSMGVSHVIIFTPRPGSRRGRYGRHKHLRLHRIGSRRVAERHPRDA